MTGNGLAAVLCGIAAVACAAAGEAPAWKLFLIASAAFYLAALVEGRRLR